MGDERPVRHLPRVHGPTQALVDAHLPGWDYVDSYEIATDAVGACARDVAQVMLRPSRLGRFLLTARDLTTRPLGIEPVAGRSFPVRHDEPELVVLGVDDRHLDFRVLVETSPGSVRCTTAVRRHNAIGRLYFAGVGPFHRLLVRRLLLRCRAGSSHLTAR